MISAKDHIQRRGRPGVDQRVRAPAATRMTLRLSQTERSQTVLYLKLWQVCARVMVEITHGSSSEMGTSTIPWIFPRGRRLILRGSHGGSEQKSRVSRGMERKIVGSERECSLTSPLSNFKEWNLTIGSIGGGARWASLVA